MNKSTQLRQQFIDFFIERGHTPVRSAPLIPSNDPTLLFTNAGMNQFKDVFLEQGNRPYSRAVDSQKCIRVSGKHNDLEAVGKSISHHTFFEMLGNWSFGDYYKQEAVKWAWELVTGVWKIDPDRLYATIFKGDEQVPPDEEARQAWIDETGIPKTKVSFHGHKDNFWEMGEIGPCGPCSELHFDLGPAFCSKQDDPDHECAVNGDCGRIVELWNLVFIQYYRDDKGDLHPLPRKHVDTGAGFERLLMVTQGVNSNYETELFVPLIDKLTDLSGVSYEPGDEGISHRIAADHVRALSFAIADGILPSNEGRGYVLRRILRRAARYGREIGLETPFLYKLIDPLIDIMGGYWSELEDRRVHITGVIRAEEESFARTLGKGLEIFGSVIERMSKEGEKVVPGDEAFKLYDTYGFPLDLTELMARERNLSIDHQRFDELMAEQRLKARGESGFNSATGEIGSGIRTVFVGYDETQVTAKILSVNRAGDRIEVILDQTPFYAEAGGQVSDHGWIESGGCSFNVVDVHTAGDAVVHSIDGAVKGTDKNVCPTSALRIGIEVTARIDLERRLSIQYNHTATHLLHTALRKHIGSHASQAGSLVAPERMRFDFTHFEKLTDDQVEQVERTVNAAIRANYPVTWYEKPFQEAIDSGVIAMFGEKYGDVVRILQIGDQPFYSRELCGGTHVKRTGEIGLFKIISESAVSAGVRRIEVVTGEYALELALKERQDLDNVRDLLGSHGSDPVEKLVKTLDEKKAVEKELHHMIETWAASTARELLTDAVDIGGAKVVSRLFDTLEIDRLKLVGDAIRSRNKRSVALLNAPSPSGAGQLCCVVGDELIAEGKLKAGALVSNAGRIAGGGGGGKPHMATAGAKRHDKLELAVEKFPEIVRQVLESN